MTNSSRSLCDIVRDYINICRTSAAAPHNDKDKVSGGCGSNNSHSNTNNSIYDDYP